MREQGQGPLVVLAMAGRNRPYLAASTSWVDWVEAGFHVVAPDMRGFKPERAPADIGACYRFSTRSATWWHWSQLGEKQAVIVGHDWGAPVAWHAAMFRPDIFTIGSRG